MSVASLIRSRLLPQSRLQLPPKLDGKVDGKQGIFLFGWVANVNDLRQRLNVDVYSGDKRIATGVADRFREDLHRQGFGDGKHMFACELPEVYQPTTLTVRVQVRETGTFLQLGDAEEFPLLLEPPTPFIGFIAADIVNNCNLRCPFCLVDYSQVTKTELMSEETFLKTLEMIYTVEEGQFHLSCLHEPTLHPHLNRFLELIPKDARKRVWFTTNLARPLSAEIFTGWARSGMHHVNVSLDSMDPELFAVLRKFGRYEVFKKNLDLMTEIFREYPDAPKLRYITMAFKSNFDEIAKMVTHSNERWLSTENEVRYTYNLSHIEDEFRSKHYLDKSDWPILTERLLKLPYHCEIVHPPDDYEEDVQDFINFDTLIPVTPKKKKPLKRPLQLRMRPNGNIIVIGRERDFGVNIHDLKDPAAHFRNLWKGSLLA